LINGLQNRAALDSNYNGNRLDVNGNNFDNNRNGFAFGIALLLRPIVMKTFNNLYPKLYSLSNLILAWKKARKHKTKKDYVIEFERNLKENILNLRKALRSVFAIAEAYPQLRANENFIQLQQELSDIEDKVAYARQFYNDSVMDYNNTCRTVPGMWFAKWFGKKEGKYLEIPAAAREVPKVKF